MRIRIEEGFPLVEAGMDSIGTNTAPGSGATSPASALGPQVPSAAPDLVTVPTRQGLEAVDIIRRGAGLAAPGVGPVLHDGSDDTLGFLVPPGTADAWDLPGSACTQTNGRGMRFGDLAAAPTAGGTGWLLPPTPWGRSPIPRCCARRWARRPG